MEQRKEITKVLVPRCTNCAHKRCMFYGEDRNPIYNSGRYRLDGMTQVEVFCWKDPTKPENAHLL